MTGDRQDEHYKPPLKVEISESGNFSEEFTELRRQIQKEGVKNLVGMDFNKFRISFLLDQPTPIRLDNIKVVLDSLKQLKTIPKNLVYKKNPRKGEIGKSTWEEFSLKDPREIPIGTKFSHSDDGTLFIKFPFNPIEKLTVSSKEKYKVKGNDTLNDIFNNYFKKYFPYGANLNNVTIWFKKFDRETDYYVSPRSVEDILKPGQSVYLRNGEIYIEEFEKAEKEAATKGNEKNIIRIEPSKQKRKIEKGVGIEKTREIWSNFSDEEFKTEFKKLRKEHGGRKKAALFLAKKMGISPGFVKKKDANLNFQKSYKKTITEASNLNPSIPIEWIEEVIYVESKGFPLAISKDGALGLMQMLHFGFEKNDYFKKTINPFDPEKNILRATEFLAILKRKAQKDLKKLGLTDEINLKDLTFHYYNRGETAVRKALREWGDEYSHHIGDEAREYIKAAKSFRDSVLLAQK